MNTITGKRFLTINASAGELYELQYESEHSYSVFNNTDDVITLSESSGYREDEVSADCISIAPDGYINNLSVITSKLYIRAAGSGKIAVVKTK